MLHDRVRDHLRGVAVGLLTPFDDELEIHHHRLVENAESLYERGARTFLACANISEYHSLSHGERVDLVRTSVDALPTDTCVLGGLGGSTKTALDLARAYADISVDALMVMPPMHTFAHERGLLTYYERLAGATDTPVVPYVRGFHPSAAFLGDLTRIDGVVGIKYAIEDGVLLGEAVGAGSDDVVWVNGLAEPYAPSFWAEGIEGFTAGVSNFRPAIGLALHDALTAGQWDRARRIRDITLPFQRFRGGAGTNNELPSANSVPALKRALELTGLHGGPVREPLVGLSAEGRERVEQLYAEIEDAVDLVLD